MLLCTAISYPRHFQNMFKEINVKSYIFSLQTEPNGQSAWRLLVIIQSHLQSQRGRHWVSCCHALVMNLSLNRGASICGKLCAMCLNDFKHLVYLQSFVKDTLPRSNPFNYMYYIWRYLAVPAPLPDASLTMAGVACGGGLLCHILFS